MELYYDRYVKQLSEMAQGPGVVTMEELRERLDAPPRGNVFLVLAAVAALIVLVLGGVYILAPEPAAGPVVAEDYIARSAESFVVDANRIIMSRWHPAEPPLPATLEAE